MKRKRPNEGLAAKAATVRRTGAAAKRSNDGVGGGDDDESVECEVAGVDATGRLVPSNVSPDETNRGSRSLMIDQVDASPSKREVVEAM
jgi:hypothetical protein